MPGRGMQPGKRLHAQVRIVKRDARDVALDRYPFTSCCFLHLQLQVEAERRGQRVVPRPQVRRGSRDAPPPAPPHCASTACSTASIEASQGTTCAALASAVCGSFSPCPVSTHTTRPEAPYFRSP